MKQNQKGFTLIEVLIVVVIIAVLASLILPRMTGQTERAVIAEAQQMLGALSRGQQQWMDMSGSTSGVNWSTKCGYSAACVDAEWKKIGVTPPAKGTGSFDYTCDTSKCKAARANATGTYASAYIELYYSGDNVSSFNCENGYVPIVTSEKNNRGCSA